VSDSYDRRFALVIVLLMLGISLSACLNLALHTTFAQVVEDQNASSSIRNNTISYAYNLYTNKTDVQLSRSSVSYHNNVTGYLVYPEGAKEKLPAVIMIHEWWGLNEQIKRQADTLAKEGYVVLAADLYNGKVAADPNLAMELSSFVRNHPTIAIENLQSAVRHVRSLGLVDGTRVATLGWCFGGDWSLQLALNSTEEPLAATILYYGRPVSDIASLSNITWPVLGIFGDRDQSIPLKSVNQFASALNASRVTNEIYVYKGVGHAFANPSGDNYAAEETADAWKKTVMFLKSNV